MLEYKFSLRVRTRWRLALKLAGSASSVYERQGSLVCTNWSLFAGRFNLSADSQLIRSSPWNLCVDLISQGIQVVRTNLIY